MKKVFLLVIFITITITTYAQTAAQTLSYWEKGRLINEYLSDEYGEIENPTSNPKKIKQIFEKAGKKLRKLDKSNVDPLVIDFSNKMIHYYETTSQLVEIGSNKSWWEEFYKWLAGITNLVGGLLDMNMVVNPSVGNLVNDEQKRIYNLHQEAAIFQLEVISKIRQKHKIELEQW